MYEMFHPLPTRRQGQSQMLKKTEYMLCIFLKSRVFKDIRFTLKSVVTQWPEIARKWSEIIKKWSGNDQGVVSNGQEMVQCKSKSENIALTSLTFYFETICLLNCFWRFVYLLQFCCSLDGAFWEVYI